MMKKAIFLFFLLLLLLPAAGQNKSRTFTGTVKDSNGEPIPGAAVMLEEDSSTGAVTDIDGKYTFHLKASVPKRSRISVSSLGFKTALLDLPSGNVLDVVLEDDFQLLDEAIAVGYGSMRKSDLTGAVASVKVDEKEAARNTSLDQLLIGRAAGVDVSNTSLSPDGGVSIRIRGTTSLNGSNEPLYVVDGVILSDNAGAELLNTEETEEVNGLMGINPQDIERIEVLKDASATAIFGAAGANGVVLITTRQASKDKLSVDARVGFDISIPYKHIDVMGTPEYLEYMQWLVDNHPTDASTTRYAARYLRLHSSGELIDVDWQNYVMRPAPRQRYYISLSGKPQDYAYTVSLGYSNTQGLIRTTSGDQLTTRFSLTRKIGKKFTASAKLNFAYINSNNQQGLNATTLTASSSVITSMLTFRPLKFPAGDDYEDEYGEDEEDKSSPAMWLSDAKTTRQEYRITPNLNLKYNITSWLTLESSAGGDYRLTERAQWKGVMVNRSASGANGVINEAVSYRWNWDNNLLFKKKFGRHSLSGTLGMTMGRTGSTLQRVHAQNIKQYIPKLDNFNAGEKTESSYIESFTSNLSFFARVVYNYHDRYVLTGTFRADGSSQFSARNRFAYFPSLAAAWRINNEPWFHMPLFSLLKLRLGWGRVGNSRLQSYQVYSSFKPSTLGSHVSDADYIRGLSSENIANQNLKWETTEQWNAGLDVGLWSGRLTFSVEAYYKKTFDLLQQREIPLLTGFPSMWINMGDISNRGVEFNFEAIPLRTRHVEWTLSGNFSLNRNKLDSFGVNVGTMTMYDRNGNSREVRYTLGSQLGSSVYFLSTPGNIFIEGGPLGLLYGYLTDGIVQEGETGVPLTEGGAPLEPGRIKYRDLNGNGYIDIGDRTILGDSNPTFSYGFNTTLTVYGFTLSAVFQGVYGRDILNTTRAQLMDPGSQNLHNAYSVAYCNAWTAENRSNEFPKLFGGLSNAERAFVTDRVVEDASFLRISSVSLSYNFKLPKKGVVRALSLGFTVQNPYVFTKYSGWDPNVSSFGSSMKRVGIDSGSYPSARTFCLDFSISF